MFTFLENLSKVSRGFHQFPKFDVYRRSMATNIEHAVRYYRDHDFAVRSDHLLVKLLSLLPTRYIHDVNLYVQDAYDYAYDIAARVKITNPSFVGESTTKPWLFGGDYLEFPLAIHETTLLDPKGFNVSWRTQAPLRFIRHPRTDLGLQVPNGRTGEQGSGVVIYLIDIPLLATMFWWWRKEQSDKPADYRETVTQFIAKYVLSNSIPSLVNVSFFNRLSLTMIGDDVADSQWRYPFALPNNLRWVDEYLKQVVDQLTGNSYTFTELLRGLTAFNQTPLYDLCTLPDAPKTRQYAWLTYMAQAPYVLFLLRCDRESDKSPNLPAINEIRRDLRYAFNDNLFRAKLPNNLLRSQIDEFMAIRNYSK